MTIFTASLVAATLTTSGGDVDIFDLTPDATTRLRLIEVELNQYSDFADAEAEIVGVTFIRAYTSASDGSAITPANVSRYGRASVTTVLGNGPAIANTGTPITLLASAWNLQAGFIWRPPEFTRGDPHRRQFVIQPSERLVIRVTSTFADDVTANCTVTFEEIGKAPKS